MLERVVDHLGSGVVLAVVDPGVGGARRSVALEVARRDGPRFFVGPDNGLLMGAVERRGGVAHAVALARPDEHGTFDGRDVLGPAAAALCNGDPLASLGPDVDPSSLVRLRAPVVFPAGSPGRDALVAEVIWVDRFGNVQLAARPDDLRDALGARTVRVVGADTAGADAKPVRGVRAFSELAEDEFGLLLDANGHLAVVVNEGSAAERLGVGRGSQVELAWPTDRSFPAHPPGYDPR